AEDGIRDGHVTGVQTCALPIFHPPVRHRDLCSLVRPGDYPLQRGLARGPTEFELTHSTGLSHRGVARRQRAGLTALPVCTRLTRSEERRVGKEGRDEKWRDE